VTRDKVAIYETYQVWRRDKGVHGERTVPDQREKIGQVERLSLQRKNNNPVLTEWARVVRKKKKKEKEWAPGESGYIRRRREGEPIYGEESHLEAAQMHRTVFKLKRKRKTTRRECKIPLWGKGGFRRTK